MTRGGRLLPPPNEAATMPGPCEMAISQFPLQRKLQDYVLDKPESERKLRGLFTSMIHVIDNGPPQFGCEFVPLDDVEAGRDEISNDLVSQVPSLRAWLRSYDPRSEVVIAAALTFDGKGSEQDSAQAAKIPVEDLRDMIERLK